MAYFEFSPKKDSLCCNRTETRIKRMQLSNCLMAALRAGNDYRKGSPLIIPIKTLWNELCKKTGTRLCPSSRREEFFREISCVQLPRKVSRLSRYLVMISTINPFGHPTLKLRSVRRKRHRQLLAARRSMKTRFDSAGQELPTMTLIDGGCCRIDPLRTGISGHIHEILRRWTFP